MKSTEHLWAVGYDDMERANHVRDEIIRLGWVENSLLLTDLAVVVRHLDGSFTLDRERFPTGSNILGASVAGDLGHIADDFVKDAQRLMKPGTSAIFVLDSAGDMDTILHAIRGLGGTVLKTNVDVERARLIQSTLAAR